ncbi:MAG: beta-1,6-N-acetylglucosaminyltransferase [Fibrobacter sp.]|nr:beta-1,6-N-acetylglucosaminyltransferase [Fibrobacter sp.]
MSKDDKLMQHCLIITAYKDINQINKLIQSTPNEWGIFVHIDKKSNIRKSDIDPRAIVQKQFSIYWGSINHLVAFLNLISIALNSEIKYDYFHLITGQDFFATKPQEFDQQIELGKSYVETHACPRPGWWGEGYDILEYRSLATKHEVQRTKFWKIIEKFYYNIQKIFHLQKKLPTYPIFCGSVYCSLYRDAAKVLIEDDIAKDLLTRLKDSKCAEEVFIQTVLMNSTQRNNIVTDNMRYIDWSVKSPPKFLNESDFENIIKSKKFFCRKIDSSLSGNLTEMLTSAQE